MRFIVDENLPPRLVAWLRERGHDATHVHNYALGAERSDLIIADIAGRESRVILTKDSDFDSFAAPTQVLRLTIGNCSTGTLLAWLEPRLAEASINLTAAQPASSSEEITPFAWFGIGRRGGSARDRSARSLPRFRAT
ncbi:MAG: DUF5615 family PIN-like protein [Alphaproteobacteria bacterium]